MRVVVRQGFYCNNNNNNNFKKRERKDGVVGVPRQLSSMPSIERSLYFTHTNSILLLQTVMEEHI